MSAAQLSPSTLVPHVGDFIGETPEDRHAERIVGEMVAFLDTLNDEALPRLAEAMRAPIGGSIKAQQRFIGRIEDARAPSVIDITATLGKRCKFTFVISMWICDDRRNVYVHRLLAVGDGPRGVKRTHRRLWRMSRHALVRLVQRAECHDALKLLDAMRALAWPVLEAMAHANLAEGDGKVLKVPFAHGVAIVEWPMESETAVVKTVLPLEARQ